MTNEEIIKELNDLIQLDYDAAGTYEQAIENVDEGDLEVRKDLQSFRQDHLRHISDLRNVVLGLGVTPEEPGTGVKSVLLEGMTKLRSATGTMGALKAMRMNEKLTNRSYEQASKLDLPDRARTVVSANFADEVRHLASIEAHIRRLGEEPSAGEEQERRMQQEIHPPM